jgi:hypothetical protein
MKGGKTKAISVVSDKHLSSLKVYFRWKSESNFQSCDLLEEICGTILHLKYMQMRQCLGDLILQPSLENRISSLMYKEGLYNKLDNLLRNLNLQYKIHSRN